MSESYLKLSERCCFGRLLYFEDLYGLAWYIVFLAARSEKRTKSEAYLFFEGSAVAKIGSSYQTIRYGLLATRVLFDPLFPLFFQVDQTLISNKINTFFIKQIRKQLSCTLSRTSMRVQQNENASDTTPR